MYSKRLMKLVKEELGVPIEQLPSPGKLKLSFTYKGKDFYIKIYESGHSHFYWKGKSKKRNAMRLVKLIKAIADFGSGFSILIDYEEGLI
ncbi:hypothetical protein [Pyrococcus kukulkanii]|uniref:hypothetical protein n=1 Tax=Pyrococcus kukulkanii TaxID=1609559 RepID=UPI003562B3FB